MRSEEITTFMKYLKEEIQFKFGGEIAYAKDCHILSQQILEATKRQLSESTLKRFFGIIDSPFKPSRFTLDTLAVYLGFTNWQDFVNSFEREKHTFSYYDSWEQLKNRVNAITELSSKSIKSKEDALFAGIPLRSFADSHFESFLKAPQAATAFVAPGGYGKTTLITQLTEKYFTGENAIYPNDIICLIDGSILYNLITQNVKINRLYQLLKFDPQNSFSNYFRENPDRVKGRFVMIFDGFNEMYLPHEKLIHFIGNLMKIVSVYENVDWFKLVITCRPDIWKIFSSLVKKNSILQSQWYNVHFNQSQWTQNNVPLLDEGEIQKCSPMSVDEIRSNSPEKYSELNELLKMPLFIHLLQTGKINLDPWSGFGLVKQYVCEVLLSGPYQIERTNLLKSIVHHCDKGSRRSYVSKDKLFPKGIASVAYNEMVSYGIFKEFTLSQSFLDLTTYVEFSQDFLFEFIVANKWIEELGLNQLLFENIYSYYQKNPSFRDAVLKFTVQYIMHVGENNFLEDMIVLLDQKGEILFPGLDEFYEMELRSFDERKAELVTVGIESRP